nr:hypothetical protein [Tanacetum cinerariifolium]
IVQIYLRIINSGCSKHMTVIAGYGDVIIGSMTIKRVYCVEGLVNNLVKNNLVRGLPKMKFENIIRVPRENKERFIRNTTSPKRFCFKVATLSSSHGFVCGETINGKRYVVYHKRIHKIHGSVNVNFDEISEMASKQFSLEPGLSNLNETEKSSNPTVSQVEETSKKDLKDLFHNFYDDYFNALK